MERIHQVMQAWWQEIPLGIADAELESENTCDS